MSTSAERPGRATAGRGAGATRHRAETGVGAIAAVPTGRLPGTGQGV